MVALMMRLYLEIKHIFYRGMAYFYLLRIYQHTRADDSELSIPIAKGLEPQPKATVADVKKQILEDLTTAYNGLKRFHKGF